MIVNYLKKKDEGGYQVFFVNLATGKKYTVRDNGEDKIHPISWMELESVIATEVSYVTGELEEAMTNFPITEKDEIEVRRLNNKLKYLLDYEHIK